MRSYVPSTLKCYCGFPSIPSIILLISHWCGSDDLSSLEVMHLDLLNRDVQFVDWKGELPSVGRLLSVLSSVSRMRNIPDQLLLAAT